jgi:hypothetical protein
LGYCGLKKIWGFTQDVLGALDSLKTKEDYKELINSLNTYVAVVHGWIHHYFLGISASSSPEEEVDLSRWPSYPRAEDLRAVERSTGKCPWWGLTADVGRGEGDKEVASLSGCIQAGAARKPEDRAGVASEKEYSSVMDAEREKG